MLLPIGSMYAIYGNIYHQYSPNVSIYTIHGSYGLMASPFFLRDGHWDLPRVPLFDPPDSPAFFSNRRAMGREANFFGMSFS